MREDVVKAACWTIVAVVLALAGSAQGQTRGSSQTKAATVEIAAVASESVASSGRRDPVAFVQRFRAPELDAGWTVSDGWDSGEWFSTEWRRSQFSLSPQGAVMTLAPSPEGRAKPYMSSEISTTGEYRYGYFESRLRMPRGNGLVSAFFTFTRPNGPESWNEIDMELTGYDPHRIELVYHVAGQATLQVVQLPFDASAGFHTYAFDWRPDAIYWYIDHRLVHVSRDGRVGELTRPQRMFASLWNSERMPRWLGVIEPAEAPWRMVVSCMSYAPTRTNRALCAD